MAIHLHKVKVKRIGRETEDSVSIEFDIPAEIKDLFKFKQGQSISIKSDIDGGRRSYSISSSPLENKLEVIVKQVPKGVFSTFALNTLREGDTLEIMEPTGSFSPDMSPANRKNYLFFAAGSGITPVISIMKTILMTEPGSTVELVYGNKSISDIIYKEKLERLKNKYMSRLSITYIISREPMELLINSGHIDKSKLEALQKVYDYDNVDEVFVCGPEEMIFTVRDYFLARGLPSASIHYELFVTNAQINKDAVVPDATGDSVPVINNGVGDQVSQATIMVDGQTYQVEVPYKNPVILDAGLDQGIDLPYSCHSGVCTTCRAKLLEGKVEMDVCYGLEDEEVKEGYILTCQAHPRTPVVKVDYDA